jgi:membrane fusion protein (multidrug efflux system)
MAASCRKPESAPPAIDVEVATVAKQDVPIEREWVGTIEGFIDATIRAQVQGYLVSRNYREGDRVKKGQLLFTIDPRPFQAALDQAQAMLDQAQAQHYIAQADLERIRPLAEEKAISKRDLDNAVGTERSTLAAIIAAQAAVNKAHLDLGFTKIASPIDGVAGFAIAQIGDLVGPAQGGELTVVSRIDTVKVAYAVSEQFYLSCMKCMQSPRSDSADAGQTMEHEMVLADGSRYPYRGRLYAVNRQVDAKTGTLQMEAIFPNPGDLLRPGQFVRVIVTTGTRKNALLVPQRAVTEMQGIYQVAIVRPDRRVELRQVRLGEQVGDRWIVDEGLEPDETVVAEGIQKVREGSLVAPMPSGGSLPPDRSAPPDSPKPR